MLAVCVYFVGVGVGVGEVRRRGSEEGVGHTDTSRSFLFSCVAYFISCGYFFSSHNVRGAAAAGWEVRRG